MAAAAASTYSADAWTFNYAGIAIESGKGPDEFLKSETIGDGLTLTVGLDGEGVFNVIGNDGRKITLTLLFTSKGNAILSAYLLASRRVEGGLPAPLYVEDRLGTTSHISQSAMIAKLPDFAAAKEAGIVVWEFICQLSTDSNIGGDGSFVGSH